MTPAESDFAVHRVVVALESACENLAALERAAEFAQRAKVTLHAMFIEDARLLGLAALPFTRQVSLSSGTSSPLEPGDVEAEFRALASRARRCLEDLASRMHVACSFEIVRGDRSSAVSAAGGSDLLVVETTTRAFGRHLRMPTDWLEIAATCGRACLLLGPAKDARKNVLVVYDGSPAGDRAVAAAVALGGVDHARLIVARLPAAPEEAELRRRFVASPRVAFRRMAALDVAELRRAIAHADCGLVIAPAPLVAAHRAELGEFLAAPTCALLLVA